MDHIHFILRTELVVHHFSNSFHSLPTPTPKYSLSMAFASWCCMEVKAKWQIDFGVDLPLELNSQMAPTHKGFCKEALCGSVVQAEDSPRSGKFVAMTLLLPSTHLQRPFKGDISFKWLLQDLSLFHSAGFGELPPGESREGRFPHTVPSKLC